jgi:hypothetical protein
MKPETHPLLLEDYQISNPWHFLAGLFQNQEKKNLRNLEQDGALITVTMFVI